MNNITMILFDERQRLENCVKFSRERLLQVCEPALIQKTQSNPFTGEEVIVSYIELDKFTPEQREQFDIHSKRVDEQRAKLCVFENFVKGLVPQTSLQSFNQYVSHLDDYKNVSISCNNIELDDEGKFSKYSIKVGPINVESLKDMSFDEYSQLYTSSLVNLLTRSLANELTEEEARQQLQDACAEVYLQQEKKNSMTL